MVTLGEALSQASRRGVILRARYTRYTCHANELNNQRHDIPVPQISCRCWYLCVCFWTALECSVFALRVVLHVTLASSKLPSRACHTSRVSEVILSPPDSEEKSSPEINRLAQKPGMRALIKGVNCVHVYQPFLRIEQDWYIE